MVLGINLENAHDVTIIKLNGQLLSGNCKMLDEVMGDQFNKSIRAIALDVSGIDYMDSSCASLLTKMHREAALRKMSFSIIGINDNVEKVLKEHNIVENFNYSNRESLMEGQHKRKKRHFPRLNLQMDLKI